VRVSVVCDLGRGVELKSVDRKVLAVLLAVASLALVVLAATAEAAGPSINAGPQAGTVWQRGLKTAAGHTQSPNLIYHGGPVRTSGTSVFPIFWGTTWTDAKGTAPAAIISGIQSFYGSVGGTSYLGTNSEYYDTSKTFVSTSVTGGAYRIDNSQAVSRAPQTSDILAEVAREYPTPTAGAYYPVYVDQPRGHAGYCAWHSSGTINGVQVQFGFFFKLDGDPGCDPRSTVTSNEGLAALGNVSGHELSEMLTDPQLNAWYDSKGAENSDKCAWTFGSPSVSLHGTSWKIQGNWSNNAYDAGTGYTDASAGFVRGCIDGN
jgi:hypothetical protein